LARCSFAFLSLSRPTRNGSVRQSMFSLYQATPLRFFNVSVCACSSFNV
jgi:hypothetical protein